MVTAEPIGQLKQDLTGGGRLDTLEFLCTESNAKDLQVGLQKYNKALWRTLTRGLSHLYQYSVHFHYLMPCNGDADVKVLGNHFFDGDDSET